MNSDLNRGHGDPAIDRRFERLERYWTERRRQLAEGKIKPLAEYSDQELEEELERRRQLR